MPTTRADALRHMSPQLIADVTLYPTAEGGKKLVAQLGWGCPCMASKTPPLLGYDGWPLFDEPMVPGEHRRLGFVFMLGEEAAEVFRRAGTFYLWERRFVGEAVVVNGGDEMEQVAKTTDRKDGKHCCPLCGESSAVRPKLLMIDEAWIPAPGKDPRLAYFADLRVDDVEAQYLREHPLEQFIDGFYCDRCKKGFVSEEGLRDGRRRYK